MRLRILVPVLALLGLGAGALAEPAPRAAGAVDPLDQLIARAGFERQLGEFQSAMRAGLDQAQAQNPQLDGTTLQRLRSAIDRIYAPARLQPRLRKELARMLAPNDVRAALAWIDSPVGRHFAELERRASEPAQQKRLMEAMQRGGAPAMSKARSELLHELVRATRTDEFAASLLIESAAGTAEGIASTRSEAVRKGARDMRDALESQRAVLVHQMHEQSYVAFAVSYAEASDAELKALLRFARTPEGARFHLYSAQAFEATAAQAGRELGADLAAPVPASM